MRWLFRRDEIERALDTDLADYIERSAAEKMRGGMTEAEARRAARIELGGVEQTKESVRATLSFAPIDNTLADMGYALRTMRRQKTFTTVAVLTLALGIGVNVGDLLVGAADPAAPAAGAGARPAREPDRSGNGTEVQHEWVRFRFQGGERPTAVATRRSSATRCSAISSASRSRSSGWPRTPSYEASVSTGELTRSATVAFVSGSYFSVLGVQPALGRLLGPEDDRVDGQAESVVLSHTYWQSEFGGDPDVLGKTLTVEKVPLTIVGVVPEGFHGTAVSARPSVFVPITISTNAGLLGIPNHDGRDFYWVHLFARLEPRRLPRSGRSGDDYPLSRDPERSRSAAAGRRRRAAARRVSHETARARARRARANQRPHTRSGSQQPEAAVRRERAWCCCWCCANVAGLILLRATTRSGEIALRASLGATRMRIVSLQLAESLVLALPAAILSLPVAWVALRGASRVPGIAAAAPDASLSATAALVAIGVAVAAALVVGLLPIRGMLRIKPGNALQAFGARHTTTKSVARFRTALATAQVALSMALLAMMGVFAQSLANIARLDLGADIDSVVMFEIGRRDGRIMRPRPEFSASPRRSARGAPGRVFRGFVDKRAALAPRVLGQRDRRGCGRRSVAGVDGLRQPGFLPDVRHRVARRA